MKIKSLEALRNELNLKPLEPKQEKEMTCRKCGAVMRKTGDNVYVCDRVVKNKDGSDKRCGNFYVKSSFINK